MTIRNVSRVSASLAALVLAACGGGGGGGGSSNSGGGSGSTPDAPPVLTVTRSSDSVEAGATVVFTITAQDARDGAVPWTLTCDQGTVDNGILTAPEVDVETTIFCTVMASDSAGNQSTRDIAITVRPAGVLALPEGETSLQGGQFGLLFASNLTLDQETYQGELDGEAITLVRHGTDTLLFGVPTYFSAGEKTVSVTIAGRTFTQTVNVTAAPVIDDPLSVVTDVFQDAKATIEQLLADEAATLTPEQTATLQGILDDIDEGVNSLSTMTPADLQGLAVVLTSNGFAGASASAMNQLFKVNLADCENATSAFLASHLKTVRRIGIISALGVVGYVLATPEPVFTKVAAVAIVAGTLAYVVKASKELNAGVANVIDKCIVEFGAQLIAEVGGANGSQKAGGRAVAYAADTRYGFRHNEPRTFQIERTMRLHDTVLGRMQQAFNRLVTAINSLPYIPAPAQELLENMKVETTELLPASEVSLGAISSEHVTGSMSASGDSLTLRFKAVDAEAENIDFTFSLTRTDEDPIVVPAQLTLELPEAEDGSLTVIQGRAKDGLLQVRGADSLELVEEPKLGTVTLQADGSFTYTPGNLVFGEDSFVYRARNEVGTSEPATVNVTIERQFEGAWQIVATETIQYESQPGLCPSSGTTTFTVNVTKVSDTLYQASLYGYTMNLTMPSKDFAGGLSGSFSISYPDGEDDLGETNESITVVIYNSNELSGTNGWIYQGPGGTSCSANVDFTGTRP